MPCCWPSPTPDPLATPALPTPLRILHVIPSISPRRGGPSQAVLAMVAAQRRLGLDAAILTTNDDGPGLLTDLALGRWCQVQEVPVLAFARWSPPLASLREFAVAPALVSWLLQHIRTYHLLHVHALFSFPSTAAMAVARRRRVPYILRTIGQLQRWSLAQSAGRKRLMLDLIERRNLQGAAALHFTSTMEQQEAAVLGLATPTFVLPLGVDPSPQPPAAPARPSTSVQLLFLSRLHPKKQVHLLLEALNILSKQGLDGVWMLHIAGEGEPSYVAALQQRAEQLEIDGRVHWHGFVAGEAKASLLREADWFVLPSAAENFGVAAVEALANGVPTFLFPGVALAEQVALAGAGYCVAPTATALATALQTHARQPPSSIMRNAARKLAQEHFGWQPITMRLLNQYQSFIRH